MLAKKGCETVRISVNAKAELPDRFGRQSRDLGDLSGDIRSCEADFSHAFGNFSAAFKLLYNASAQTGPSHDFAFDVNGIKPGIRAIGYGMLDVAAGVKDCHLQDLADILGELATKLGTLRSVERVAWRMRRESRRGAPGHVAGGHCAARSSQNAARCGYSVAREPRVRSQNPPQRLAYASSWRGWRRG